MNESPEECRFVVRCLENGTLRVEDRALVRAWLQKHGLAIGMELTEAGNHDADFCLRKGDDMYICQ